MTSVRSIKARLDLPGVVARREIAAGLGVGVLAAIAAMGHGMIAFAPLGPAAVGLGMAAALASSVVAGVMMAMLGSTRPLVGNTSASTALLTGSLMAAAQPPSIAAGMLLAMLVALLAAGLILLAAVLRLGRLATFIPTPVTTGLTNAVILLVVLTQLPIMAGLAPGAALGSMPLQAGPLLVGLTGVVLMLRPLPGLPPPLVAIAGAAAVNALLPRIGLTPGLAISTPPTADLLLAGVAEIPFHWADALPDGSQLGLLASVALLLAMLAMIEITSVAVDVHERTGRRGDVSRDLYGGAAAMLGGAATGGIPGSVQHSVSLCCLAWGGHGRAAMLTRAGATLAVLLVAAPLTVMLPYAALAGVLVGALLPLFDWRGLVPAPGPGRARRLADAGVVLAVIAAALSFGLLVALATGLFLAVVIFAVSMAQSPVRRISTNPVGRSRVRRPPETERRLREAGERIHLLELEGAIFFGSADLVVSEVTDAIAAGAEVLIIDLGRVTRIDLSGGRRLLEACRTAPERIILAPMHPGSRAARDLEALGLLHCFPAGAAMPTLADAVEAAEERLLARLGAAAPQGATPQDGLAALGLPDHAVAVLLPQLVEETFPDATVIARQGDLADSAWLLLEGEVLVSLPAAGGMPATRLAVLAPGVIFGESALLRDAPRTADMTARGTVRCLRIGSNVVETLRTEAPDVAWKLMTTVARQLTGHVVAANATIDRLAG
jgi:SulP family sulfate permease